MIGKGTTELTNFKNSQAKSKMKTETQGAKLAHKLPLPQKFVQKHLTLRFLCTNQATKGRDRLCSRQGTLIRILSCKQELSSEGYTLSLRMSLNVSLSHQR